MSTKRPGDERRFDGNLNHVWREGSHETPPSHVDAAILAAAREESRRTHRRWFTDWQTLAAAATVAGLAFVLVQLIPRDRSIEQPVGVPSAPANQASRLESHQRDAPPEVVEVPAQAALPAGSLAKQTAAAADMRAAAPPAPTLEAPAAARAEAGLAMTPAQWAARIEALYRSGDVKAAESELRAFRTADAGADQHLPVALRAWAATVR
jgi:cell division septation protein DedD